MAEFVSPVLERLLDFSIRETQSLRGVDDQIKRLQTELKWMQASLENASSRRDDDKVIRQWVSEIREAAYDAEDVIETYALKKPACFFRKGCVLYEIGKQIEAITNKLSDLSRRLQTYNIPVLGGGQDHSIWSSSGERQERRRSYPHVVENNVVGFDHDIEELVSVLLDEQKRLRAASVCGMGGLGKTTLAKRVYHHTQIRNHFRHFAWAYVSEQCRRRNVWEAIFSSFLPMDERDKILKLKDEELAEKLHEFLKHNKCLVVLDDIWGTDAWDKLEAAFPREETGSKMLITSRNKDVALHIDPRIYLHELQCLKDEDSWELFQKVTFPEQDSKNFRADTRMEELGKDMLKDCAGLPLAITVLAGILATKHSVPEWQTVHQNVKAYLRRGKGQGVHDVLALSYDDLPPYLRPCFLYLGHFPEDYEIPVSKLIQLWVAEGLILSKQHEGDEEEIVEDVAECHLNELVERCMIQVGKRDTNLKIKTCRMHDLMRDLCLSKAKEENFLYIIGHSCSVQDSNVHSSFPAGVRRIAIHEYFPLKSIKNPHLRSLLVFNKFVCVDDFDSIVDSEFEKCRDILHLVVRAVLLAFQLVHMIWRSLSNVFNHMKLLRVLHLESTEVVTVPSIFLHHIGNLIHLRFLSLRSPSTPKLPSSLGTLRQLETLDLRAYDSDCSVFVPNVIWKIERLRHLYLPKSINSKTKLRLDNLRNLQTLVNFPTKSCDVGDLRNMTNLRELGICGPLNGKDSREDFNFNTPIVTSKHLRSLSVSAGEGMDPRHLIHLLSGCPNICELSLDVEIRKLPEYHQLPRNITSIYLRKTRLDEDPIPALEKLPDLRSLTLEEDAFIGKEMYFSSQGFPELIHLTFDCQASLEEWRVDEGALQNLQYLKIISCKEVKVLPVGLKYIKALQKLEIKDMPKALKDKLVEGGEDFDKVQHVLSVIFHDCDK